jgi:hypothetical protein
VPLDFDRLRQRLIQELTLVGSATSLELRARLGISQPSFSRLVASLGDRVLTSGKASATRYAARRSAQDLPDRLDVYEVDERGHTERLAVLHSILPGGYYVESHRADLTSSFYQDLPYFLHDLRPAGFLGRLVPTQHPELGLPGDVRNWSSNDTLRYLQRWGFDAPGSLIVGDVALEQFLVCLAEPPAVVAPRQRTRRYPELAEQVLEGGNPGSSAGGEQPKFLATLASGEQVLVKFSPRSKDASAKRQADLLICEYLAHRVLEAHGQAVPRSELVLAGERVFLEVGRFDRSSGGGRRGVLSLLALDAEFVGRMHSWTDSTSRLVEAGQVPESALRDVRLRELFGKLIFNTDMHPGNLSFIARGAKVLELAPVYDMLPMHYSGTRLEEAPEPSLPIPAIADAEVWEPASQAAIEFWNAVAKENGVSAGFRRVARANTAKMAEFRRLAQRLPRAR